MKRIITTDGRKRILYSQTLYDQLHSELVTRFGDGTKIDYKAVEIALYELKKTHRKLQIPTRQTILNIFDDTSKPRQKRFIEALVRLAFNSDLDSWIKEHVPQGPPPTPVIRTDAPALVEEFCQPGTMTHWKSTYHFYQQAQFQDQWINEDVTMSFEESKLCIRSEQNPIGDNYLAQGKIVHGFYFVGEWLSIEFASRGGAIVSFQASGAFLLTLVAVPKLMYGYFTGPRNTGERIFGAWVLAKDDKDLKTGKELLVKATLKTLFETNGD